MTTGQTIASPTGVNIKISSPHFQKNSIAKSDTFSQKSIASRSQSPVASKSAKRAHPATDVTTATSATRSKQRSQED